MTQRTVQRFAAVAALAAVLFLGAAAAPAQARDLGSTPAWQRLQDLWSKAVSVLWPWSGPTASESRNPGGLVKAGPAVDPDGSPGSTPPASMSGDEAGGSANG
jgi:hypothetical protein